MLCCGRNFALACKYDSLVKMHLSVSSKQIWLIYEIAAGVTLISLLNSALCIKYEGCLLKCHAVMVGKCPSERKHQRGRRGNGFDNSRKLWMRRPSEQCCTGTHVQIGRSNWAPSELLSTLTILISVFNLASHLPVVLTVIHRHDSSSCDNVLAVPSWSSTAAWWQLSLNGGSVARLQASFVLYHILC